MSEVEDHVSSEDLLRSFADGDDSALGRLVEREAPWVLERIEKRLPGHLRPRLGASDVLQMTLMSLLDVRDRFENRGMRAFRKMLATMADLNAARTLEHQHAAKRNPARERPAPRGQTTLRGVLREIAESRESPSDIVGQREAVARLARCFRELTATEQQIVRLIDYDDVGYNEAAEQLGISVEAARQRHHRTIVRLRSLMKRHAPESA